MGAEGYEIRIHQENGDIFLDQHTIKKVTFKISTAEQDVKDRSANLFNSVEVIGSITPETKDETRKLILWAMDKLHSKVYREMSIILRANGEVLRTYAMNKVFCIDYTEEFNSQGAGEFTLVVAQRKDNLEEIQVGSV